MPIIATDNSKPFTPAPEGVDQAVCCDVVDLGMEDGQYGEKHKVSIRWQTSTLNPDDGRPYLVQRKYTLSLNEKAALRGDLEAWRGRKFTPAELAGFDLEKLIGVNCQLNVLHHTTPDGKVYANVQSIMPLGKGMEKIEVVGYTRVKDRENVVRENGDGAEGVPF